MSVPMCHEKATWKDGALRWDDRASVKWPDSVAKPRTCSHCGSVHPEDLAVLFEQGWEIEQTGKCYKFYIHPPGHAEEVYRMAHAITEDILDSFVCKVLAVVPCVKLYMSHVDASAQEQLNKALMAFVEKENNNEQSREIT